MVASYTNGQQATVAQLEAQVKLDQAAIDNVRAILQYTTIVAPLDGRTGIRQVDEGNIVRASDATGIVKTIMEATPVGEASTMGAHIGAECGFDNGLGAMKQTGGLVKAALVADLHRQLHQGLSDRHRVGAE